MLQIKKLGVATLLSFRFQRYRHKKALTPQALLGNNFVGLSTKDASIYQMMNKKICKIECG